MKSRSNHKRSVGSSLVAVALMVGFGVFGVVPESDARRPMPAPPVQPAADDIMYECDIEESSPPRSVEAAYEEYYQCLVPVISAWDREYSEEMETLDVLYRTWQNSRGHDLRGTSAAAAWVRNHPVDFRENRVRLSSGQVDSGMATTSSMPAMVAGTFQRFFVDRGEERLFLSTDEQGLVSLDISERYAFEVLGSANQGARDFFIYDGSTAFLEETEPGRNGDLVVLDISNPSNPREVSRMRGVLPAVSGFVHLARGDAPSFAAYRLLHEGRLSSHACGTPPTVSTHPNLHCRLDGSCYRREIRDNAEEGVCEARPTQAQARFARRPRAGRAAPTQMDMEMGLFSGGGGGGMAMAESAPAAPTAPPARSAARAEVAEEAMPTGGEGGAGSLSQMMVHGTNLYVLRAAQGVSQGYLLSFDVSQARSPRLSHILELDNGPEALQRHDNLLLVAGRDALSTVSLGEPTRPRLLGEYRQECPVNYDPVVVEGAIAYRTIIVDNRWSMCTSRLEVIDLSQPHRPLVRSTTNIARPRGLSVLGDRLFVADEGRGVQVFDLTDPVTPRAAGTLKLTGVKDLVLSGFDLYAMSDDEVRVYYVAPLYQDDSRLSESMQVLYGITAVQRGGADES